MADSPETRETHAAEQAARRPWLRTAYRLALLTVAWNIIEGVVGLGSGVAAGSVALIGFAVDSIIETASAVVAAFRARQELRGVPAERLERIEKRTSRVGGALLLLLAAYIVIEGGGRLLGYGAPAEVSGVGIGLTAVSLVVMVFVGARKLAVARRLGSGALRADAMETVTCAWLSTTTLAGLLFNALLGWRWADPLAALLLVPLIVREGIEALRHESHSD